jgi:hypothetical protein
MKNQNYLERNNLNLLWERTFVNRGPKRYRAEVELLVKGEIVTFKHDYNDSHTFDNLKDHGGIFDYFEHTFVEKIEDYIEYN